MASSEHELKFIASLEDNVSSGLSKLQGNMKSLEPEFKKMAVIGAAGFGAITGAIGLSIKAFADSEKQLMRVESIVWGFSNNALKSLGGSIDSAKDKIAKFGTEMQSLGGIADEEASEGLAKLIQITDDYSKAQDAAILAADLATFKQIDYSTAVDIVGKVLGGNTGILARYGITLKEGATVQEAINALTQKTMGQYEAFGTTVAGQTEILKQSFGDLQEEIGKIFAPMLLDLVEKLKPLIEKLMEWVQQNPELVKQIVFMTAAAFGLIAAVGTLSLAFIAFNPIVAGVVLGAAGLVFAIKKIIDIVQIVRTSWDEIWTGMTLMFKEKMNEHITFAEKMANGVIKAINAIINAFNSLAGKVPGVSKSLLPNIPEVSIPRLAEGGIVTKPTFAQIGEAGPEAVIPLKKNGMFGNTTINITGNTFMSDRDAAEKIGDMIIKRLGLTNKLASI